MTIRDWLNSDRNYAVGVALYDTYGTDSLLKQMFQQGFSSLRAARLFDELLQLKNATAEYTPESEPEHQLVIIESFSMPEEKVAAAKDPFRNDWLPKYQEMNLLRHSLETINTDTDRGSVAHRILDLEQECMAIWKRRDYFLKTGKELITENSTPDPVTDMNMLTKRLHTVRSYISKYTKSTKPAHKEKLEQFKEELSRLNEQLNIKP